MPHCLVWLRTSSVSPGSLFEMQSSGSSWDPLSQNLHFNKVPRWLKNTFQCEKWCSNKNSTHGHPSLPVSVHELAGLEAGHPGVFCSLFSCNMFFSFSPTCRGCPRASLLLRSWALPNVFLFINVAAMNISIHVSLGLVPWGGISGIKLHEQLWTLISHHSKFFCSTQQCIGTWFGKWGGRKGFGARQAKFQICYIFAVQHWPNYLTSLSLVLLYNIVIVL